MHLTYVCIVIGLISILSNDAFPYSSPVYFDDNPSSILVDSPIIRREVFDPYGFNSILTRFIKRDSLYDINTKKIIHLIEPDEYNFT